MNDPIYNHVIDDPPPELIEYLQPYPPHMRELHLAARALVIREAPDATEVIADATNAVSCGYTFTHTHVKGFCFVASTLRNVVLGFPYGVGLVDPEGRLCGEGNRVRHLKLKWPSDLDDPYLLGLLRQAIARAFRPDPPLERRLVFMIYKGPKKRPG